MRTIYNATVQVDTKHHLDVDHLMTALADYKPVLETSPQGWYEIHLSVSATNLTHACHTAISVATAATGAAAIACEIMTAEESDQRHQFSVGLPSQSRRAASG
jgi:hypothetical protein